MEKICLNLKKLPMLDKEVKRLEAEDSEVNSMMHIENYVDIYKGMLGNSLYDDNEKKLIQQELLELTQEIARRNNADLVGEVF